MPRPGPRPYECVRRAWHSDRHQPIRGSLIQELFRLANETHSTRTRRNKEWQQKLPFVVLKAEEIMYSKANSEDEYVDPKTLLERANDAIDTIIRKEDVAVDETGDFLPPCIEAALNLGCVPRRASRSERHNTPRCYLSSPENHHHHVAVDLNAQPQRQSPPPHHPAFTLPPGRPSRPCTFGFSSMFSSTIPSSSQANDPRLVSPYTNPANSEIELSVASRELATLGHVYPLFYPFDSGGSDFPSSSNHGRPVDDNADLSTIETRCLYDFLGPKYGLDPTSSSGSKSHAAQGSKFDLSLRLGPSPECLSGAGGIWSYDIEDAASNTSYGGVRL